MLPHMTRSLNSLAFVFYLAIACHAKETQPQLELSLSHPRDAITFLQNAHKTADNVFVIQQEIDALIAQDGGGACPSAAAIDLIQVLRAMSGSELLLNPHKVVLSAFANQPRLLNGRVPNEIFRKVIQFYEDTYLPRTTLKVVMRSSPGYSAFDRKWSRQNGPMLSNKPNQVKVLSYTVTTASGEELGRHFVILKDNKDNIITVLDPTNPTKNYRYRIGYKHNNKRNYRSIFLTRPDGGNYEGRIQELNTVVTATIISNKESRGALRGNTVSIERIKSKIDENARTLRCKDGKITEEFLSPIVWRESTAKFGLPGLDMPIEYGGSGWPASQIINIYRHIGRHNLNFRDVVGGAHGRLLLHSKNPEVEDVIRSVVQGRAYIAVALTEPTAGSDFYAMKSYAEKTNGGYLLTGEKRYVARLKQASHVVLFTKATSGHPRELSAFLVPLRTDGLEIVELEPHGLTGNSFGGLRFQKLFVPTSHLIGEEGKGGEIFTSHFRYWRLMQAATAIGTGEGALLQMADRLKTREAFGGPIGRFTHLQQPLGQYTTELCMAASLAQDAAELLDRGGEDNLRQADLLINGLKAEGIENALSAVDAASRAFGAEGYSTQVDLGNRLRDLNGLRIADGTTDVMRMTVVRNKFGSEFWNMAVRDKKQH